MATERSTPYAMDLFLKILGGIALIVLAMVTLVALWVVWKWKLLKAAISNDRGTPSTVKLVPLETCEWTQKPRAQHANAALIEAGFQPGRCYEVTPISGVSVQAFYHPELRLSACLYDHPFAGIVLDVCATFEADKDLTVSNSPYGREIETRPATEKIFLPKADPRTVIERAIELTSGHPLVASSLETFASEFEEEYKKDMAWRSMRGGITEEELRRVAANSGIRVSEAIMQESFHTSKLAEIEQWEAECIESLQQESDISLRQWKRFEDNVFIFRTAFAPVAFARYLAAKFGLDDEQVAAFEAEAKAGNPVDLTELLHRLSAIHRVELTELGCVSAPIRATVFGFERPDVADSAIHD